MAASIGVKVPNQTNSAFPLAEERLIEERSPWELRTRFELEKELAIFRSRDKSLGEALVWIVDDLLQDESGARDKEQIRLRKREALESLSYVRDVLMTKSMELDEDRLMGGASNQKRKSEAQTLDEKLAATTLRPLSPASIAGSRFKQSGMQQAFPVPLKPAAFRTTIESKSNFSKTPSTSHTRSKFNASSVPSATMPRPPTPISTGPGRQRAAEQAQPKAEDYMDPLGVLG
jgi:TBC1 domain family protein 5